MKSKLSTIGLGELFINRDKDSHLKAMQRMVDIFHQEAFTDICRSNSRFRTYGILKREAGFEKYHCEVKSVKERKTLTKFRISNHPLMIEKGRHQDINKENRYCPFFNESASFSHRNVNVRYLQRPAHKLHQCPHYRNNDHL